jgi:hypothetical protein
MIPLPPNTFAVPQFIPSQPFSRAHSYIGVSLVTVALPMNSSSAAVHRDRFRPVLSLPPILPPLPVPDYPADCGFAINELEESICIGCGVQLFHRPVTTREIYVNCPRCFTSFVKQLIAQIRAGQASQPS